MQTNDAQFKALADNGYESLYDWLLTFKSGDSAHINDLWKDTLVQLSGLPAEDYAYNDYLSTYLNSRGYVGSISDGLNSFWNDIADGTIPLPQSPAPT